MDDLLARITVDPAVLHGKPCIRGLRYPVELILDLLAADTPPRRSWLTTLTWSATISAPPSPTPPSSAASSAW